MPTIFTTVPERGNELDPLVVVDVIARQRSFLVAPSRTVKKRRATLFDVYMITLEDNSPLGRGVSNSYGGLTYSFLLC